MPNTSKYYNIAACLRATHRHIGFNLRKIRSPSINSGQSVRVRLFCQTVFTYNILLLTAAFPFTK